jgi:hypothetical protein
LECSICHKSYPTYDEVKACYLSHQTDAVEETIAPPTLDALKNLLKQHSEPVKHIGPKHAAVEGDDTPKNWVNRLIGIAKDGNGTINIHQIRYELQNKSIIIPDVLKWFSKYAVDVYVEPHPGNTLYLTFGRSTTRTVKHVNTELAVLGEK